MTPSVDRISDAARLRERWSQRTNGTASISAFQPPLPTTDIGLSDLLAFLRRRMAIIAIVAASSVALGMLYVVTTPEEYSGTATLVIDPGKVQIFNRGDVSSAGDISNSAVETELQILQSMRVADAVIKKLQLTEDPEFMKGNPEAFGTLWAALSAWTSAPAPVAAGPSQPRDEAAIERAQRRARGILAGSMKAQRIGLSYAINVAYTNRYPNRAAQIANTFVDAYLDDDVNRRVDTAQKLTQWLRDRMAELRAQGFDNELGASEQSAFRLTYDQFIRRYAETLQQESPPMAQAAMISAAVAPSGPVWPKGLLIFAMALVLGTLCGLGAALVRDLLDRAMRTRQQLESVVHASCLGMLPEFRVRRRDRKRRRSAEGSDQPHGAAPRMFYAAPQDSVALTAPLSQFAETLRSVRIAAEGALDRPAKVLGVVSSFPKEGKTTLAVNLAQLAAQFERVLLIDGDFRNPTLSSSLVPSGSLGLAQLVTNEIGLADVLWTEASSGLTFLPTGADAGRADGSEILGSAWMKALTDQLRASFDFIIVDLPPVLPVVDVRAAGHFLDGFVFVVEWGKTTEEIVKRALRDGCPEGKIVGTLLNKVVASRLRRFERNTMSQAMRGYLQSYRHVA
jgi:capsular exopolysaccharide synthesis family protein